MGASILNSLPFGLVQSRDKKTWYLNTGVMSSLALLLLPPLAVLGKPVLTPILHLAVLSSQFSMLAVHFQTQYITV